MKKISDNKYFTTNLKINNFQMISMRCGKVVIINSVRVSTTDDDSGYAVSGSINSVSRTLFYRKCITVHIRFGYDCYICMIGSVIRGSS